MTPQGEPATVIISSTTDLASRTLASALVGSEGFASTGVNLLGKTVYQKGSLLLAQFEGTIVEPPDLDEYFNPQAYIFLSRHSAESGIASLTAHTTGNFTSEARFGGAGRELGRSDPSLLKNYLAALWKRREDVKGYEITLEATHHGPTSLQKPVLFVELGSSERYWGDTRAAEVVASALVESLTDRQIWSRVGVAFGGTHYSEKFTRILIEEEIALAYVAPKYALGHLDEKTVEQMLQRSTAPVRYAVLDWKGLGPQKEKVVGLVRQFGLEEIRV
ncbi:MAG: D-tyrosyl-tRNA(Tyr) deacylase [Nitrososphaerota archaeon]|nr:D-tyrosyl-tRNA(Tyr) deacylase [Nitrososphaerota archaeon]